jgi:SlyX protein
MNNDRMIELEIKVAYQEDLVQELNKIVSQQQNQIDRLEAMIKLLHDRIKSMSVEHSNDGEKFEKPPHY